MTRFIRGSETFQTIQEIFKAKGDIYAAVACWNGKSGKYLEKISGENIHVVVDVSAGRTSAQDLGYLIKQLGERVRVSPDLHTKIYASEDMAFIGALNASERDLRHGSICIEAGLLVTGEAAASAFIYAKELFDAAEVAGQKHVDICRKRFRQKRLARGGFAVTSHKVWDRSH